VLPGGYDEAWFAQPALVSDTQTVVRDALARRGWSAEVHPGELPGLSDWRPHVPSSLPTIDIVIPTRDRIDLVKNCLASIEAITTYPNWNIIILDNDSVESASLEFFASTRYQVVPCPGPFNYAAIMNRGIRHATGDFVLTLNNDTIVLTPDWLEQLLGLASLPDVGIVGACLIDQYGRGEHESIVIAPFPQHLRTWSNYPLVDHFSRATRDVAAVTGAVQMIRRSFYDQLGGMDEGLRVTMNDVDICLRSHNEGKSVLYTPHVRLTHHVSSSRGSLDPFEDRNRFLFRWDVLGSFQDPFFPEALRLYGETVYYRP
jgi:GT2 family glycosyltransferase